MSLPEERTSSPKLVHLPRLRDRARVFHDRADAGRVLANMLAAYRGQQFVVLAVPAGGVPVAAVVAERLALPLDVAVVNKITLPWSEEVGYGAVAYDGTVLLNEELLSRLMLSDARVQEGIALTRDKVARRVRRFRGGRALPDLIGRGVILIDDGLASGITARAVLMALRRAGPRQIILAVPTAHEASIHEVIDLVDQLYCANLRKELPFAVAKAYERWSEVSEDEAADILARWMSAARHG